MASNITSRSTRSCGPGRLITVATTLAVGAATIFYQHACELVSLHGEPG